MQTRTALHITPTTHIVHPPFASLHWEMTAPKSASLNITPPPPNASITDTCHHRGIQGTPQRPRTTPPGDPPPGIQGTPQPPRTTPPGDSPSPSICHHRQDVRHCKLGHYYCSTCTSAVKITCNNSDSLAGPSGDGSRITRRYDTV